MVATHSGYVIETIASVTHCKSVYLGSIPGEASIPQIRLSKPLIIQPLFSRSGNFRRNRLQTMAECSLFHPIDLQNGGLPKALLLSLLRVDFRGLAVLPAE